MFRDREDAGERLADRLQEAGIEADVVLAIPRGGLPLGRAVADRLDAPLDVVIARKMGAPNNEELAMGAVAEDGTRWLNEGLIERLGVTDAVLDRAAAQANQEATEKAETYREGPPPTLANKRVVLVDDGIATGATMRACMGMARAQGAAALIVAVPVGPHDTLSELAEETERIVAVEQPAAFRSVGAYYENFDQVTDEQARSFLA